VSIDNLNAQEASKSLRNEVIAWPRSVKRLSVLCLDAFLCAAAAYIMLSLRLESFQSISPTLLLAVGASIAIALPIFISFGLYRAIFRYSGGVAIWTVVRAVALYTAIYFAFIQLLPQFSTITVPRSLGLTQPLLLLILIGASRAFANYWLGDTYRQLLWGKRSREQVRILIFGAGSAGRQLAQDIQSKGNLKVMGFLDEDAHHRGIVGAFIDGIEIFSFQNPADLIRSLRIAEIWLAIPSASKQQRRQIINSLAGLQVAIRTLPTIDELASGQVSIADVRQLDIDDLLNRDIVPPQPLLLSSNIRHKIVLITGAAGSIGSEMARQALAETPKLLLLLDRNEYGLYHLEQELQSKNGASHADDASLSNQRPRIRAILGSVGDSQLMMELLTNYDVDVIYHAAAYKHVPMVEHNLKEGIRNNVFGTLNLVRLATQFNVPRFILVSSDKAVRPTNIMGATKRLGEMILQAYAQQGGKTTFSMVRFGNVLGSSGSVVPQFRRQIAESGPITVTHPEITRYFMSTSEAAQLVIQAGAMAQGGEVFLLDMGKSIKIVDLATRMIELSGLQLKTEKSPYGDIEISFTGLRPGEKLFEELLIGDNPEPSSHPRIFKARDSALAWPELEEQLGLLQNLVDQGDILAIRAILQKLVAGYTPDPTIVDWSYDADLELSGGGSY
jgi:FlaA1/EpsC-like NDP-sugar epimerase